MKQIFTLEYWKEEGWYIGRLRELPGVFSQGETLKELEENIKDAYELIIEELQERKPVCSTSEIHTRKLALAV